MHPRVILSVGNFFFSICAALVSIILFPYLAEIMPEAYVGLVIAAGATIAVLVFPLVPPLVARYGAAQLVLVTSIAEMLILLALAAAPSAVAAVFLIAISISMQPLLAYELDILLDATLTSANTVGRVRAIFRTAFNAGGLAAPLLVGALLVSSDDYQSVFMAAAATLAPIVVLFSTRAMPKGPVPALFRIRDTLVHIIRHRDLVSVTLGNLILYLFFVWMPLYTPFYLHEILGIPWSTLGWVFFVMLLPYVVVEYPAGWLSDRYLGDKEMMLVGFLIAGGSLAALSLLTTETSIISIASLLVVSRIGAALVETTVNSHFHRRVSSRDISSIEVFGSAWPLSYIIAPIIGSVILVLSDYQTLFIITGGFVAIFGAIVSSQIKDFK